MTNSSRLISQIRDVFEVDSFTKLESIIDNNELSVDEKEPDYYKADSKETFLNNRLFR